MGFVELCNICKKKLAVYKVEIDGKTIHLCNFCKEEIASSEDKNRNDIDDIFKD